MTTPNIRLRIAASVIALGIICGAFGAHALRPLLLPEMMMVYEKAVFYQLIHGGGLVLIVVLAELDFLESKSYRFAYRAMLFGIILFSGSLYLLAVSGIRMLGAITPIGGVLFILSWLIVAFSAKTPRSSRHPR